MFLFRLNPNPLIAIFQLFLISFTLFLASVFLHGKRLPYYTLIRRKLYLFNNPPPPPEAPIDPDFLLNRLPLIFHPHQHS